MFNMQAKHRHHQLKDIAAFVKKELDKKHLRPSDSQGVYHCICGTSFASEPPCHNNRDSLQQAPLSGTNNYQLATLIRLIYRRTELCSKFLLAPTSG